MSTTVVVVMGVSGTGKSSVVQSLQSKLAKNVTTAAVEADDFHSAHNIQLMTSGQALSDDERWPWLDAVCSAVNAHVGREQLVLVACSALKKTHRAFIAQHVGQEARLVFLHLRASLAELQRRMTQRRGHFMNTSLLPSQLSTLETPTPDEGNYNVIIVDTDERDARQVEEAALVVVNAYL